MELQEKFEYSCSIAALNGKRTNTGAMEIFKNLSLIDFVGNDSD